MTIGRRPIMNALWGLLAYAIFTQEVLGILAYENVGTRKEWKEAKFRTQCKALTSWFVMMFGIELDSVITIVFFGFLSFAWASAQGVLAAVTFGALILLFPILLICRCLGCYYYRSSRICPPPP
jgi:hypothetical protein